MEKPIVLVCEVERKIKQLFLPGASVRELENFINDLENKKFSCKIKTVKDGEVVWLDPVVKDTITLTPEFRLEKKYPYPKEIIYI